MNIVNSFRQGDVLILQVEVEGEITGNAIPRDKGCVVLAYGEVTGHSHHIKELDVQWIKTANDDRVLIADKPFVISHEEHAPIALPAGIYFVVQQVEYSPEAIRNVLD